MVDYSQDSLKRYKVMCYFSEKDFDSNKSVQYSKLQKQNKTKTKQYEDFGRIETPVNPF